MQSVRYPGLGDPVAARYVTAFGPLLSFDVAGADQALSVERGLRLIENATSLGGVASTLEARARCEGDRVPPGLLRLSVGLEDVEDLWADLAQALDALASEGWHRLRPHRSRMVNCLTYEAICHRRGMPAPSRPRRSRSRLSHAPVGLELGDHRLVAGAVDAVVVGSPVLISNSRRWA